MSLPRSVGSALAAARQLLTGAGIDGAALEVRLLASHALGCDMAALIGHPEWSLKGEAARRFDDAVQRRLSREPLAHILARREFWSLPLAVSAATLVPRPDSEAVVEAALSWAAGHSGTIHRILDLGTGSGCLLLALLSELPDAWGAGVDLSEAALAVASGNAAEMGFGDRATFVCGDWGDALTGDFDIIIANPPYITDAEWHELSPEVRLFEPASALRGGPDGLAAYRRILPAIPNLLAMDGAAFIEVGGESCAGVLRLIPLFELHVFEITNDLGSRPRCLGVARKTHERATGCREGTQGFR